MGQPQHRAIEVAKTLNLFVKADLAEGLSLALIHRTLASPAKSFSGSSTSARTR